MFDPQLSNMNNPVEEAAWTEILAHIAQLSINHPTHWQNVAGTCSHFSFSFRGPNDIEFSVSIVRAFTRRTVVPPHCNYDPSGRKRSLGTNYHRVLSHHTFNTIEITCRGTLNGPGAFWNLRTHYPLRGWQRVSRATGQGSLPNRIVYNEKIATCGTFHQPIVAIAAAYDPTTRQWRSRAHDRR